MPRDADAVNLGPELEDISDAASVISQLDLLISVDTGLAHLAGALAKPVWMLLPAPADWRWLQEREDSPWYPTMRLFRQNRRGDWSEVVARVASALTERVQLRDIGAGTDSYLRKRAPIPQPRQPSPSRMSPGYRPGFSAVAECRYGILQYLPDEPLVGDSLRWYGEYQQPVLELLTRLTRPGATVLEVEAGVGQHALALATVIGPGGHLLVYESRRVHRRILEQNFAANRVANATVMRRSLSNGLTTDTVSETVDDLQLEQLQLLKINLPARAHEIIQGATQSLWGLRPMLFAASPDESSLRDLVVAFKDHSYRAWRSDFDLFNPANFNRFEDDIFAGRRGLALFGMPEETNIAPDGCVEL